MSAEQPVMGLGFHTDFLISGERDPLIVIIIPCFNEAERLDVEAFLSFLENSSDIELLFVDDGSTDETPKCLSIIERQAHGRVSILRLEQNQGKAEAVRQGILSGLEKPASHLGYWDADLATPLTTIETFAKLAAGTPRAKFLCGTRIQRLGAQIQRHWYRHYPGRVIATCISIILGVSVYDTQCGAKLIERELAARIFRDPFLTSWLFDVELIARIIGLVGKEEAVKLIYEVPLKRWNDIDNSKISMTYLPMIPLELARIYHHYKKQLRP
jgi:dolichyl-phosphate beta-glucosyltransferase